MNTDFFSNDFTKQFIVDYVDSQFSNFFPDKKNNKKDLFEIMDFVLDRLSFSLKHIKIGSHQKFSYLHSDLYAQFLYFLSNTAWRYGKQNIAQKSYYLNKALHSFNCMYHTELPDIFLFFHIIGTVLGKANYSNYFVCNQGVTVGANKGVVPSIGEWVMLRPNCSVIGGSVIGDFSAISANASIFDEAIPPNSLVIGSSPNLTIKPLKRFLIKEEIFY